MKFTTIILLVIIGSLVGVSIITYIYNIYKFYRYNRSRRTTFTSEFKEVDIDPLPISDDYLWFTSSERTLWKIPFDEIHNNQAIKFKVTFDDAKFASIGTLSQNFENASRSVIINGSCTKKISISRNLSIGTISSGGESERLITNCQNPIIYIENIGRNPPKIEAVERRTYNCASQLPDSAESMIIPQRISFDRENLDINTIHNTVLVAANSDGYSLTDSFKAKEIFSGDIVSWLQDRESYLPRGGVSENIGTNIFGDFCSRYITEEVSGRLVIYHIDHIKTGKAEYVRISLIDEYGEEIFKVDSVDWRRGSGSSVYIGENIWKTNLIVPMGVRCQLMESIYGPPLPYTGSVFPMSTFSYEDIGKNI